MFSSIAFFDVDDTIIKGSTALAFAREMLTYKKIKANHYFSSFYYALLHKFDKADYKKIVQYALTIVQGEKEKEIKKLAKITFNRVIKKKIYLGALKKINWHRKQNDLLVIISAGANYVIKNLGEFLSINNVLTTEVKVKNGRLTTNTSGELCYGEGKLKRALSFAKKYKINLKDCYFYTDSINDVQLLEAVGHPRVVNPDNKLKKLARKNNWKIIRFKETIKI